MKAVVSHATSRAILSHKDNPPLEFTISMFGKDSFVSEGIELFYFLSNYWESLTDPEQDAVYNLYKQLQDVMDTVMDKDERGVLITDISSKLMLYLTSSKLKFWISNNPDIQIPQDIPEECVENIDRNVTRDRTIIRKDYLEIIAMSLAMRAMVPIWGEYVPTIRNEAGTSHKEIYAFNLLRNTEYYFCRAVEVITKYIEATVKEDKFNPNILNQGISSEDYGRIMMCTTCVRKVSIADISGRLTVPNVIKLIYKSIVSKIQNLDRDYESGIKNKDDESRSESKGNEENKLSVWERYRIVFDQDIGTVTELNHSAQNFSVIVSKLGLLDQRELVLRCLESSKQLINKPLEEPQLTILKWVIRDAVIPQAIPYVETIETIATLMGLVQAKLWMEGHKYLAILSTCYKRTNTDGILIPAPGSKDHIPKELKDAISLIYPCREKTLDRRDSAKEANLTLQSIDELTIGLSRFVWRPTADVQFLQEIFPGDKIVRVPIRPSVKIDIANLVLDVGYRWNRPAK